MAVGVVPDALGLAAVRAAYAALILGVVGGLVLATGVLSGRTAARASTVAGVLALDRAGDAPDARRAEAVAALVARCMTARSLPWTPWIEPPPSIPDAELDPVAWAARWGLGVSTTVGRTEPAPPADPNLDAIGAMASDEREKYRDALDGPAGCRTGATDTVYGLRARASAPLQASLRALDRRVAASSAAQRATDAWRRCVEPIAGRRALDRRTLPSGLREDIARRIDDLGLVGGLMALQVEERRIAVVLAGCDVRYEQARAEAAAPFEAAYVDEHRPALERIGADIRSAEAALPTLPP